MMTESPSAPKLIGARVSSVLAPLSAAAVSASDVSSLEKKIQAAGGTILAVCQRARVSTSHFYAARSGQRRASRWFIRRCELALEALLAGDAEGGEPSDLYIRTVYRAYLAEACRLHQVEMARALTALQGPPVQARHLAIYLVNTELAVRGATLARLFGLTRSAITQAVQAVEDRREDPAYDKAVAEIGARITGRT